MLSHNQNSPVITNTGDIQALKSLIEKAKSGDKQAFDKVYTIMYTPLYRYVYSKTKHKELSEDLCQNTFIRFYEALSRYEYREDDGGLLPYLFVIAKRLLINESEKKAFMPVEEDYFDSISDGNEDILQTSHINHLADQVENFFSLLSKDEEDVIRLFFYAELSHKEIAKILEKEEAYIRKIKERALAKLRTKTTHLQ